MKKPEKLNKKEIIDFLKKASAYIMRMFSYDIGMGLGTSTILVYVKGKGIVTIP